jgi:hypothetical protein
MSNQQWLMDDVEELRAVMNKSTITKMEKLIQLLIEKMGDEVLNFDLSQKDNSFVKLGTKQAQYAGAKVLAGRLIAHLKSVGGVKH